MNKFYVLFIASAFIFSFSQCDMIDEEEPVPSYIEIPKITVNENFASITDAWVYIDDNFVGVYSLPAKFPVLYSGNHEIVVRPGIKVNGIAVTRGYYPFYEAYTINETLISAETIVIHPETQFLENLTSVWRETFESVAITIEPSDTSYVGFSKTDTVSDAHSAKVGMVELFPDTTFRVQTVNQFELPSDREVYLELSFKSEYYMELAWQVENLTNGAIYEHPIYQFNPTSEWQHIYIYLTNYIADYNASYSRFRFMLGSHNYTDETKYIYIDNIRLIHY